MTNFVISKRKKFIIILSIISAVAAVALFGYKSAALAANQDDLCGGTSGNGEIISVGSNTFTLKLNEGGEKGGGHLIVNLSDRATIEAPTGYALASDLKIGDRVTLVGDNHRDGTFTADAVVVCSGMEHVLAQENDLSTGSTGSPQASSEQAGQSSPIIVRNNDTNYKNVSGTANTVTMILVGLIWLGIVAFFKLKKRKSFVYLFFFTVFYAYLYKVLDYTLLQFQSLLLMKHFLPNLMLNGVEAGRAVNLIPLTTLTLEDVKTSLLNIIMMMPFGFGLPFITNFRMKKVVIAGLLLSIAIELLQLITGLMANTTFRIADINDVIFNTIGVAIGYILFVRFVRMYRDMPHNRKASANPILQYIAERPQIDKQ